MKYVIFDVGNVIVKGDHSITFRRLHNYGIPAERSRKFFDCDEYKEFSRGSISGRAFYEALIRYLGVDLTYEQIVKAHNEHIFGTDDEVVRILSNFPRELLVFLTDTNEWQTQREKELIDLTSYSDKIFRSHEMNMLKTDRKCFSHIIKCLGVKPEEILLIDDIIANVTIARHHGLRAHHFTGHVQLTNYLTSSKIL